ncbi:hypothetical protein ACHAXT_009663 [Thalassiosira profunda]
MPTDVRRLAALAGYLGEDGDDDLFGAGAEPETVPGEVAPAAPAPVVKQPAPAPRTWKKPAHPAASLGTARLPSARAEEAPYIGDVSNLTPESSLDEDSASHTSAERCADAIAQRHAAQNYEAPNDDEGLVDVDEGGARDGLQEENDGSIRFGNPTTFDAASVRERASAINTWKATKKGRNGHARAMEWKVAEAGVGAVQGCGLRIEKCDSHGSGGSGGSGASRKSKDPPSFLSHFGKEPEEKVTTEHPEPAAPSASAAKAKKGPAVPGFLSHFANEDAENHRNGAPSPRVHRGGVPSSPRTALSPRNANSAKMMSPRGSGKTPKGQSKASGFFGEDGARPPTTPRAKGTPRSRVKPLPKSRFQCSPSHKKEEVEEIQAADEKENASEAAAEDWSATAMEAKKKEAVIETPARGKFSELMRRAKVVANEETDEAAEAHKLQASAKKRDALRNEALKEMEAYGGFDELMRKAKGVAIDGQRKQAVLNGARTVAVADDGKAVPVPVYVQENDGEELVRSVGNHRGALAVGNAQAKVAPVDVKGAHKAAVVKGKATAASVNHKQTDDEQESIAEVMGEALALLSTPRGRHLKVDSVEYDRGDPFGVFSPNKRRDSGSVSAKGKSPADDIEEAKRLVKALNQLLVSGKQQEAVGGSVTGAGDEVAYHSVEETKEDNEFAIEAKESEDSGGWEGGWAETPKNGHAETEDAVIAAEDDGFSFPVSFGDGDGLSAEAHAAPEDDGFAVFAPPKRHGGGGDFFFPSSFSSNDERKKVSFAEDEELASAVPPKASNLKATTSRNASKAAEPHRKPPKIQIRGAPEFQPKKEEAEPMFFAAQASPAVGDGEGLLGGQGSSFFADFEDKANEGHFFAAPGTPTNNAYAQIGIGGGGGHSQKEMGNEGALVGSTKKSKKLLRRIKTPYLKRSKKKHDAFGSLGDDDQW